MHSRFMTAITENPPESFDDNSAVPNKVRFDESLTYRQQIQMVTDGAKKFRIAHSGRMSLQTFLSP